MSRDKFSDEIELVRREFAMGWASVGAMWGIAPSTAAVQGYFLMHGGPLTEAAIREALGLSHRAAFAAVAECERWGLIEPAAPIRVARRGPPSKTWLVVGDHWEWFRRVAASRIERETDPIMPLLVESCARAEAIGEPEFIRRVVALAAFAKDFERGMEAVVASRSESIGHGASVLATMGPDTVGRLLDALKTVPVDELATTADRVSALPPAVIRRLVRFAAQPGIARLLARLG